MGTGNNGSRSRKLSQAAKRISCRDFVSQIRNLTKPPLPLGRIEIRITRDLGANPRGLALKKLNN
jgi:hypothetical protein